MRLLLIAGITYFLSALWVLAADIQVTKNVAFPLGEVVQGKCNIKLSGIISTGDAQQLSQTLSEPDLEQDWVGEIAFNFASDFPREHAICLDSPGGNFEEAIKVAQVLRERGIISVVPEGAECLSACAFAFLAGTLEANNSDGVKTVPFRVLHVGGKLGFHSPYLSGVSDLEAVPGAFVVEAFEAGAKSFSRLNEVLSGGDIFAPTSRLHRDLVIETIGQNTPDDFYFIDTVEKAGRYDIRLAGVPDLNLSDTSYMRLCSNVVVWKHGVARDSLDPDIASFNYKIYSYERGDTGHKLAPESFRMVDASFWYPGELASRGTPTGFMPFVSKEITSRHNYCSIVTHVGAGDDFSVYFRLASLESDLAFRPVEPWHSLPHYIRIDQLHGSTEENLADTFSTKYVSSLMENSFQPNLQSKANNLGTYLRDGHTLVLAAELPYFFEAIYFADGFATHFFKTGETITSGYRSIDGIICFEFPESRDKDFCGRILEEDGEIIWVRSYSSGRTDNQRVSYIQPTRIETLGRNRGEFD